MARSDWDIFCDHVSWFLKPNELTITSVVEAPAVEFFDPSKGFESRFPTLTRLLSLGRVSVVEVDERRFHLHTWPKLDGRRCGWLCEQPGLTSDVSLHADHRILLESFGGVREPFNGPSGTWTLNLNWWACASELRLLTPRESDIYRQYLKDTLESPECSFLGELEQYVRFALEANGNFLAYHAKTGEVVMFASDHNCSHVIPVAGCPEHSFYRVQNASTFRDWIELVAAQWLSNVKR